MFSWGWGYVGPGVLGESGVARKRASLLPGAVPPAPGRRREGRGRAWARRTWLRACAGLAPPRGGAGWPMGGRRAAPSANGAALQCRVPSLRVAGRPGPRSNGGAGDGERQGPRRPRRRQVRGGGTAPPHGPGAAGLPRARPRASARAARGGVSRSRRAGAVSGRRPRRGRAGQSRWRLSAVTAAGNG